MNIAGRTILLKFVLDPVTNHVMSILKLPKGLFNKINRYRRNFLWGVIRRVLRCIKLSGALFAVHMINGSIGIRDLETNNLALLAKISWRVFENPKSDMSRLLQAKYVKDGDFWSCNSSNGSSTS